MGPAQIDAHHQSATQPQYTCPVPDCPSGRRRSSTARRGPPSAPHTYLELVADGRVVVDDVPHGDDESDDLLGHVVAGRRLSADHHRTRHERRRRVLLDPVVHGDDVQAVEQLPLVLVDPLHLLVNKRRHVVNDDAPSDETRHARLTVTALTMVY